MHQPFNHQLFTAMPVIGIARNISLDALHAVLPWYVKAGFGTLEVTMHTADAPAMITALVHEYPMLNIGAGTVCDLDDLHRALYAGASFIVAPVLNAAVIKHCTDHRIPVYPGAYTPSEIYTAYSMGATAVKVFPVAMLGPQYVKDVLAPLNKVKLLPTGGVTAQNVAAYFKAGATGVGMGTSLFQQHLMVNHDNEGLYQHFVQIAETVKMATAGNA